MLFLFDFRIEAGHIERGCRARVEAAVMRRLKILCSCVSVSGKFDVFIFHAFSVFTGILIYQMRSSKQDKPFNADEKCQEMTSGRPVQVAFFK